MNSTLLRTGGWLAVLAIGVISLVPGEARPHVLSENQWEHLIAYLLTGALLALGYRNPRTMVAIGAALTFYGGALEIGQLWVPGRTCRLTDFLHGALGAWVGIGAVLIARWACLRLYRLKT